MSDGEKLILPCGCRSAGCGLSIVVLLLVILGDWTIPEFLFHAFIGWVPYLAKVAPQITWNAEITACSVGALLLGVFGLRWLMPRLLASGHWPWRWSFAWCGLLVLLFATSIAAIGVVHQVGWLFRTPKWIESERWYGLTRSTSFARQMAQVIGRRGNDGQLPLNNREIPPSYLYMSVERDDPEEMWIYLGAGLRSTDDGDLPVFVSPRADRRGQRMLVRLDGGSDLVSEDQFQAELKRLNEHLAVSPRVK